MPLLTIEKLVVLPVICLRM